MDLERLNYYSQLKAQGWTEEEAREEGFVNDGTMEEWNAASEDAGMRGRPVTEWVGCLDVSGWSPELIAEMERIDAEELAKLEAADPEMKWPPGYSGE